METHLDHRVVLNPQSKHASLYSWSLVEVDSEGQLVSSDLIPWKWSQYFRAVELRLESEIRNSVDIDDEESDTPDGEKQLREWRQIRVSIKPDDHRGISGSPTRYSMFGTSRTIENFELIIRSCERQSTDYCEAWGSVSYSAEIDFFTETTDDTIIFNLFLRPEVFQRYSTMVVNGQVDELSLRVSRVAGFYSEWSPSISTDSLKVLTKGEEHAVELPVGYDLNPPRLGKIGEFDLFLVSRRKIDSIPKLASESARNNESGDIDSVDVFERTLPAVTPSDRNANARLEKALIAVRNAAWLIAALLFAHLLK